MVACYPFFEALVGRRQADMSNGNSYEQCPKCNAPSAPEKKFCADCGAPLGPESAQMRTLVDSQIDRAFETRFKDQQYIALETSVAIWASDSLLPSSCGKRTRPPV